MASDKARAETKTPIERRLAEPLPDRRGQSGRNGRHVILNVQTFILALLDNGSAFYAKLLGQDINPCRSQNNLSFCKGLFWRYCLGF
jgi:hypothetical protein